MYFDNKNVSILLSKEIKQKNKRKQMDLYQHHCITNKLAEIFRDY